MNTWVLQPDVEKNIWYQCYKYLWQCDMLVLNSKNLGTFYVPAKKILLVSFET